MNETINTTVMEQYNSVERRAKVISDCLQGGRENNDSISSTLEHLRTLMVFFSEFFASETLEPHSEDEAKRNSAIARIMNYAHYRNLYEVMDEMLYNLNGKAEKAQLYLDRISDEFEYINQKCDLRKQA